MTELEMESSLLNGPKENQIQESTESNQNKNVENAELRVELNSDHIAVIKKQYKKVRKYMRSSIYEVRIMDGNEKVVSSLLDKYYTEEDQELQ